MQAQNSFTTERLLLEPLTVNDSEFVFELVNTDGWLRFIGNRHVNSPAEAIGYIQKILDNPGIGYAVVKLKSDHTPIGIITVIKRDYLEHPDIGFAFLPQFAGKGYAYEAAKIVLDRFVREADHPHVLATTVPENVRSIRLLEKLGLQFEKEMELYSEKLHIYGASTDVLRDQSSLKSGK